MSKNRGSGRLEGLVDVPAFNKSLDCLLRSDQVLRTARLHHLPGPGHGLPPGDLLVLSPVVLRVALVWLQLMAKLLVKVL